MAMQKCPVCEGRQTMPETFYTQRESSSVGYVDCRTCSGSGMVRTYPAYEFDPDVTVGPAKRWDWWNERGSAVVTVTPDPRIEYVITNEV